MKMRKSLGEKRKEISPEQIEEITRLYGAFEESERVKIFRNEQFGYQRITVERPLRLRYTGEAARERLEASKAFAKLGEEQREGLLGVVGALGSLSDGSCRGTRSRGVHERKAREAGARRRCSRRSPYATRRRRRSTGARPGAARPGERAAAGRAGGFEPDPSARLASEPYRRAVEEYMAAEVLPYVPDAWVDHEKTKIGYEIPLTRHFYRTSRRARSRRSTPRSARSRTRSRSCSARSQREQ